MSQYFVAPRAVMNCKWHTSKKAEGYCQACGEFGCKECLTTAADGKNYCQKCLAKQGKAVPVRSPEPERMLSDTKVTLKLVVHFKDGKIMKGTAYKLDIASDCIHLLRIGGKHHGQRLLVSYADLKGIFHVKDFEGVNQSKERQEKSQPLPGGHEVIVHFKDGESIEGYVSAHFNQDSPRFNLVPKLSGSNNIAILVERSALERVDVGSDLKKAYLNELVDTPLKKAFLKYYWTNPSATVILRHLAGFMDVSEQKLTQVLKAYKGVGLIKIENRNDEVYVTFFAPTDRVIRDFIIREYKHIGRPMLEER